MHELDADLVVRENKTVEDLGLWDWSDTHCNLRDDAIVALATHHKVIHVRSTRDARPQTVLLVCAGWCDIRDVEDDVLDVTVRVLLHATGSCRDPASKSREFT